MSGFRQSAPVWLLYCFHSYTLQVERTLLEEGFSTLELETVLCMLLHFDVPIT